MNNEKQIEKIDNVGTTMRTTFDQTMDCTIDCVSEILNNSTNKLPKNVERCINCTCDHSSAIFTLTLNKYQDNMIRLSSRRRIRIIMFQDVPTENISVSIINGEEHKQKLLFRLISLNPISSIEKYLPEIIKSMIDILDKT